MGLVRRTGLVFALLLGLAFLGPSPAPAQSGGNLDIGVIDAQLIYREALAVKNLQKIIEAERQKFEKELQGKEQALRDEDQKLAKQRSILSSEAFAEKRKVLEEQLASLQRAIQTRRADLDKTFAQGMRQVQQELLLVSQDIAKQRSLLLVVEKSAVVLVKPELEITQEALAALDKRLPKIKIPAAEN